MSAPGAVEAFLARLYVDAETRARFLADPYAVAQAAGLAPEECEAMTRIDRDGLAIAARSFAAKRTPAPTRAQWLARLFRRRQS